MRFIHICGEPRVFASESKIAKSWELKALARASLASAKAQDLEVAEEAKMIR